MKVLLLLTLCLAGAQARSLCGGKRFCALIKDICPPILLCSGRIDLNAGICGCCPACIRQLGEGDSCMGLLGGIKTEECGKGLVCGHQGYTCKRSKKHDSACTVHRQRILGTIKEANAAGKPLLGAEPPKCDQDGTYAAVQCRGSMCVCVDKQGKNIGNYGVYRWKSTDMTCNCARQQAESAGLLGRIYSCKLNGNFEEIQCEGSVCFCAGPDGKQLLGAQRVNIGDISKLKC